MTVLRPIESREDFESIVDGSPYTEDGRPIHFLMDNGDAMCWSCMQDQRDMVLFQIDVKDEFGEPDHYGWVPVEIGINWRDRFLTCKRCGHPIDPVYDD